MKWLLLFWLVPSSYAATIVGNAKDTGGNPVTTGKVTFKPLSTPNSDGSGTVVYLDYTKTASFINGHFTNYCVGGFYDTLWPGSSTIRIMVPTNDPATYEFDYVAQLATNAPVFSYPLVLGLISTYLQMGTNVFFGTNNPGVLGEQIVISGRTNWNFSTEITNVGNLPTWLSNTPTAVSASITNKSGWCVDRGVATLVNGKVLPSSTWSYTTNIILISRIASASTTNTWVTVGAVTAGVRFEINSSSGGDTANVNWAIFLP